jgi:hypothetical protein
MKIHPQLKVWKIKSANQRKRDCARLSDRPSDLFRRLHQIHVAMLLDEFQEVSLTPVQYAVPSVLDNGRALDQVTVATTLVSIETLL